MSKMVKVQGGQFVGAGYIVSRDSGTDWLVTDVVDHDGERFLQVRRIPGGAADHQPGVDRLGAGATLHPSTVRLYRPEQSVFERLMSELADAFHHATAHDVWTANVGPEQRAADCVEVVFDSHCELMTDEQADRLAPVLTNALAVAIATKSL